MLTNTITTYLHTLAHLEICTLDCPCSTNLPDDLEEDCLLHTVCLDSHQPDFLLTAAKREHCHCWICIHTVRIVYIRTNDSLTVSYIVSLTVSSFLRTFFTANSLMTEFTSPSNTSASILATSFSDKRMVGSRGFSRLRPLGNFWKCKVKTLHAEGASWQDIQVTKQTYGIWQYNVIVLFRFSFVYKERSKRLNGRSVSSLCLTAFW